MNKKHTPVSPVFSPGRYILGLTAALCISSMPAKGAFMINGPAMASHLNQIVLGDGDTVTLMPDPVTYLGAATAAMQASLAATFPLWNFTFAVGGLNGTLDINQYKATSAAPHSGGGLLDLTYNRAVGDPTIANLHWIQLVSTNVPLGGPTSPYIDPRPNDDTLPFYWTLAEDGNVNAGNKTATTYDFFDNSTRPLTSHPQTITWRGELMLASWDNAEPGNVTVYDGVRWGWDLVSVPEPASGTVLFLWATIFMGAGMRQRRR